MSIGKKLNLLNWVLLGTAVTLIVVIGFTVFNQNQLNNAYENRYESYLRADELRQSSDDLTRLARTYVITQDKKYEDKYWDILAVRGGKKPRSDGRTIALQEIMKNLGFTEEEFGKLKEAGQNSNDLVTTETIAMNEVKGLYDDGTGKYTKKGEPNFEHARTIMFDDKYHADKKIIMDPIAEFEKLLDDRTRLLSENYRERGNALLWTIALLSASLMVLIFMTTKNIRKILEELINELDKASVSTDDVSSRIVVTSKNVASSTQSQSSAIQETVSTLDEISSIVAKNVDFAKNSAEKATETYGVAQKGKESVEEMIVAIKDINESNESILSAINESNTQISGIAEVIKGIADKTTVINDIVFQTKLLSFNASVEAARAGEHGRGFAVVAEEVGSLSQMSGDAAREISEMITESIQKVESVVEQTSSRIEVLIVDGKEKVNKGVDVANKCDESLIEVVSNIDQVKSMMTDISTQSHEQSRGVDMITEAIRQIDIGTNENSVAAQEVETFSNELVDQSTYLGSLVSRLKNEMFSNNKKAS